MDFTEEMVPLYQDALRERIEQAQRIWADAKLSYQMMKDAQADGTPIADEAFEQQEAFIRGCEESIDRLKAKQSELQIALASTKNRQRAIHTVMNNHATSGYKGPTRGSRRVAERARDKADERARKREARQPKPQLEVVNDG